MISNIYLHAAQTFIQLGMTEKKESDLFQVRIKDESFLRRVLDYMDRQRPKITRAALIEAALEEYLEKHDKDYKPK